MCRRTISQNGLLNCYQKRGAVPSARIRSMFYSLQHEPPGKPVYACPELDDVHSPWPGRNIHLDSPGAWCCLIGHAQPWNAPIHPRYRFPYPWTRERSTQWKSSSMRDLDICPARALPGGPLRARSPIYWAAQIRLLARGSDPRIPVAASRS